MHMIHDSQPTLTDAERAAVMWAIATLETDAADAGQNAEAAATLCGLLERCATGHQEGRQNRIV